MNPLWIVAIVVAIAVIGTKCYDERGIRVVGEAAYNVVEYVVGPLILTGTVLAAAFVAGSTVVWMWSGGAHGWCESSEVASTMPVNWKLTEDEFMELLNRHRAEQLTTEQTTALAVLESHHTLGCWHGWGNQ